jgi:hypothetical protein
VAAGLHRVRDHRGGTWRLAGCEHPGASTSWAGQSHRRPTSTTPSPRSSSPCRGRRLAGPPADRPRPRGHDGNVVPLVTIVTDNGGPFRSFRFEAFIATHPELRHSSTRVRSPGRTPPASAASATSTTSGCSRRDPRRPRPHRAPEDYRTDYNTLRPPRPCPGTAPSMVHTASPIRRSPTFPSPNSCQQLDAVKEPPPDPTRHHHRVASGWFAVGAGTRWDSRSRRCGRTPLGCRLWGPHTSAGRSPKQGANWRCTPGTGIPGR